MNSSNMKSGNLSHHGVQFIVVVRDCPHGMTIDVTAKDAIVAVLDGLAQNVECLEMSEWGFPWKIVNLVRVGYPVEVHPTRSRYCLLSILKRKPGHRQPEFLHHVQSRVREHSAKET
jgi:hypothetical protein